MGLGTHDSAPGRHGAAEYPQPVTGRLDFRRGDPKTEMHAFLACFPYFLAMGRHLGLAAAVQNGDRGP